MKSGSLLVVVDGDFHDFTFPGARWYQETFARLGVSYIDISVIGISSSDFEQTLAQTTAHTVLCIGKAPFIAVTGLEGNIIAQRGYIYAPMDRVPVKTRMRRQIGVYKTTRKQSDGTIVHEKGSPRIGLVDVVRNVSLSRSVVHIIPTFDFDYLRRTGFSAGVCIRVDLRHTIGLADGTVSPLAVPAPSLTLSNVSGPLCLDIETIGFSTVIGQIGLSNGVEVVSLPWTASTRALTQSYIDACSVMVGHNLAFDVPRLEADGVAFGHKPRFDTMLAAAILNPDLHKGLEKASTVFLPLRPWKHTSSSDLAFYNASDAFITYALYEKQLAILESTGMADLFVSTIMPATSVLIGMTSRGLKVDSSALFRWQAVLRTDLKASMLRWSELVPHINPMSANQIAKYFYYELNLPKKYTKRKGGFGKKGAAPKATLSVDESALKELRRAFPAHEETISTLLRLKKAQKSLSTYATIEFGDDGCVHPSYLPSSGSGELGNFAATGRLASSNPNIQNQTLESKRLFIPHVPEWKLLEFDSSQIELRIAAALSGDVALLSALEGDVHARTMELIGCDRTRAKNLIYGTLYGAGPRKLYAVLRARGISTSVSECAAMQNALARAYPQLWAWRSSVAATGVAQRYLSNVFGRRRNFFTGQSAIPEMYDYFPQSTAADILWNILVPLDLAAKRHGGNFLTTTHDSGLFEFPEPSVRSAASEIRSICEQEWPMVSPGFKVPIKFKIGDNWGEMEPYEVEVA